MKEVKKAVTITARYGEMPSAYFALAATWCAYSLIGRLTDDLRDRGYPIPEIELLNIELNSKSGSEYALDLAIGRIALNCDKYINLWIEKDDGNLDLPCFPSEDPELQSGSAYVYVRKITWRGIEREYQAQI